MAIQRGIFSSSGRAWLAVIVYTLFLYATLTLAFDIYVWFYNRMGKLFMSRLMIGLYIPVALLLLAFLIFHLPRRLDSYVAFGMIGLALGYSLHTIDVPAKRFHFLQYGPLTVLILDALRFRCRNHFVYMWALLLVALIGLGDEALQGLLPNRYFGFQEVVTNTVAGLFALAFVAFVMGEDYYPWGRSRSRKRRWSAPPAR